MSLGELPPHRILLDYNCQNHIHQHDLSVKYQDLKYLPDRHEQFLLIEAKILLHLCD